MDELRREHEALHGQAQHLVFAEDDGNGGSGGSYQ